MTPMKENQSGAQELEIDECKNYTPAVKIVAGVLGLLFGIGALLQVSLSMTH